MADNADNAEETHCLSENEFNLVAALTKIGGDLMLAAACAADTAQRIQTVENAKLRAVVNDASGKVPDQIPAMDREGVRLANESLAVAIQAFTALSTHGYDMLKRNELYQNSTFAQEAEEKFSNKG
jgi:hypothetical protein